MSVLVSKRKPSEVQYIENARELELFTLRKTRKMPKRWNHLVTIIERSIIDCYVNCKLGNSIMLMSEESRLERKQYFDKALKCLYTALTQIDIAKEAHLCDNITQKQFAHWIGLIDDEIEQIKKIERSDITRIK